MKKVFLLLASSVLIASSTFSQTAVDKNVYRNTDHNPVAWKTSRTNNIDTPHVIVDGGLSGATAIPTSDAGAAWTTVRGVSGARFTSADQSAAVASVTDAPTSGQKLVVTDVVISSDTALRVDLKEETSGTVINSVYMAANSTVNLITRGKTKLATANKKLQVQTSAAGNISVNAYYYSEL